MENAANTNDRTDKDEYEMFYLKINEVVLDAQLLLTELEQLMDRCTSAGPSEMNARDKIPQVCQANIEEDGETLVIEGFRFWSATNREDLRRQCLETDEGSCKCKK